MATFFFLENKYEDIAQQKERETAAAAAAAATEVQRKYRLDFEKPEVSKTL